MITTISILFGIVLIIAGIMHLVKPKFYSPLVPSFISLYFANWFSFFTEVGIGVALLLPEYRSIGGIAFSALMLIFLPLHIWDLTKEKPAIGSKGIAIGRVILQFVFIYLGWWIYNGA